ncbi:cobyrinate a,c-diamide synthase [Halodesulfovibrio marinisediminis]|uniref:Cobyrinate a,c-diamide synthase n=1 Tax=Halodesulfovibrio marinisediminis DSM 17456 TaxID=1121457 RepID=A0A1N6FB31_9BACT|nr:cobyrinate a,c-diamide synthase [Halodesulfovibrio marinisediminis]SIN92396.1 hydrogenobyrinic acid a,c-diamide synthase (glutamine-hydrolysing) [Halodesulfovibrio marinisediminis DSM 17456]
MTLPRIIIAGLSGGTGKTITSLGTTRAWSRKGRCIKPFKKGPDYIDAKWLALAAQNPCTNLDPYLLDNATLNALFATVSTGYEGALIEGNRGLFDGKDVTGTCSTAELARVINTPVILAMDCTKMTRTAAAVLTGMLNFEEGVHIAGVVLNRTATDRHRSILRQTIEHYTDVPVLGCLPKIKHNPIPERHMGLISNAEYEGTNSALEQVADIIEEHLDIEKMWKIASAAPNISEQPDVWDVTEKIVTGANTESKIDTPCATTMPSCPEVEPTTAPRIGYVHDDALWFYYDENLQALQHAGAQLVRLSITSDKDWPQIDALYLGGGFPETMHEAITANKKICEHVRALAENEMPIYAECGGFMFLCKALVQESATSPMAGVLPVQTKLCKRPQGLGYIDAEVIEPNPYHPLGSIIRGHEFHYSKCIVEDEQPTFGFRMSKGFGMGERLDGVIYKNVFASYTHLFALGEPHWAVNFVRAAQEYKSGKPVSAAK